MKTAAIGLGVGLSVCLGLFMYFVTGVNRDLGVLSAEIRALRDAPPLAAQDGAAAVQPGAGAETESRLDALERLAADLAGNIEAMRKTLLELQQGLSGEQENTGNAEAANVEVDPPPRLTAEETRALLEQALSASSETDPAWSTATVIKVDRLFQELPELAIAESADTTCGGELCKVTAVLPAVAANYAELFHITLLQSLATELPRAMTKVDRLQDGAQRYTVYMARAGYRLPTEGGGLMPPDSGESGTAIQ